MKDKSKRLTVVNTEKKPSEKKEVQQVIVKPSSSSSSHAPGFNPNLYLLKSVWDSVFEIKTDVSGQKYIFGKLPVVTKYGITMYADDGNVEIPQLAEGLPYDQRTIWFNPETKQIEVIGGTGGGGEGGVSNFWDLSGIPSWITNSKPIYNYSEIKNTPDLSVFVTGTALSETLADYATLTYLTGELKKYVTLDGAQDIKGVKNFVNGLKIGGLPITKKQDDVVYLDANLVVRGGITMYGDGEGGSSVPSYSTLGSLLNVDESNDAVASVDRVLFQSAGSNVWSWKALSEIGGGSSGGGSVSGDYLPLSGGTITGIVSFSKSIFLLGSGNGTYNIGEINSTSTDGFYIEAPLNSDNWNASRLPITLSWRGGYDNRGGLRITNSDEAYLGGNKILHAGNYSSYALPLSGGTVTGNLQINGSVLTSPYYFKKYNDASASSGYIGVPHSDNNNIAIVSTTSSAIEFITSDYNVPRMIVMPNGNVGIGTTNPQNKLDVNGYVEANSFILDGYGAQTFTIGVVGVDAGGLYLEGPWYDNTATQKLPITITWRGGFNNQGGIKLDASANMLVTGGITMYSDQRKKTILNHVELSLKQIADAPLIEHYYNSDQDKTTHVGSIAQYWAGLNDWFCKLDNEGYYTMEIQNCALASAISIARHLERYESKTDKTIRKMKKRIQELEDEVERLKKGE